MHNGKASDDQQRSHHQNQTFAEAIEGIRANQQHDRKRNHNEQNRNHQRTTSRNNNCQENAATGAEKHEKVPGGRIFPPPAVICSPSPRPTVRLMKESGAEWNCSAINRLIGIMPSKIHQPIFLTSSASNTLAKIKMSGKWRKFERKP